MTETDGPACYGVALGAVTTLCCDCDGELYRNELGGHTSASLFAVSGRERQIGEAAVSGQSANAKNTVTMVGNMALTPHGQLAASNRAAHISVAHTAAEDGFANVTLEYGGEQREFPSVALLGALLGKIRATSGVREGAQLSISLPAAATGGEATTAHARLSDAASIGGWKLVAVPSAAEALGAALVRKYPFKESDAGGEGKRLLVLDVGHTGTCAAILKVIPYALLCAIPTLRSLDCSAPIASRALTLLLHGRLPPTSPPRPQPHSSP